MLPRGRPTPHDSRGIRHGCRPYKPLIVYVLWSWPSNDRVYLRYGACDSRRVNPRGRAIANSGRTCRLSLTTNKRVRHYSTLCLHASFLDRLLSRDPSTRLVDFRSQRDPTPLSRHRSSQPVAQRSTEKQVVVAHVTTLLSANNKWRPAPIGFDLRASDSTMIACYCV